MRRAVSDLKVEVETKVRRWYVSRVVPGVRTEDEDLAKVIRWADENPHVWQIVRGNKSVAFGASSSFYMGYERGPGTDRVLARAARFYYDLDAAVANEFHRWRVGFTFDHYRDPGFTGGIFWQHDGSYPRGCACLDYTPATLGEVVDRFFAWCEGPPLFHVTKWVEVDGKVVRGERVDSVSKRMRGGR